MPLDLTPEAWAQVRHEYEHTDKPVDDICLDHGISPNTLRDRVRRWRWTRRRQPIPAEGPPPMPVIEPAAPLAPALPSAAAVAAPAEAVLPGGEGTAALPAPHAAPIDETPVDPAEIVPRLQGAVARVLPAIEATVARLAGEPMPPREMERAVRTLTSLTRTLRELNELLGQHQPAAGRDDHGYPEDIDAFRNEFARRINAFVVSRTGQNSDGAQPKASGA